MINLNGTWFLKNRKKKVVKVKITDQIFITNNDSRFSTSINGEDIYGIICRGILLELDKISIKSLSTFFLWAMFTVGTELPNSNKQKDGIKNYH